MSAPTIATVATHTCPHDPPCPSADAQDHDAARVRHHDPAGFSVLCSGVILFDDTGELVPDDATHCHAVAPHRPEPRHCTNSDHPRNCCERKKTMTDVRPGQIWADNDKRSEGRKVRVVEVDTTHAIVVACDARGQAHPSILRARRTRIRLDRFKPTTTGYRLVEDIEES